VAEAEVYIQYGRDRHAKDILIDAMRAKEYPDEKTVDMYIILMGIYTRIGNELERQKELDNIKYLKSKGYALTNAQDTKIQDILNIVISKKATV
jgi:Tfp pilus assembly protein FimV